MRKIIASLACLVTSLAGLQAQILYTTGNYSQNFDSLSNNGTSVAWTDNSTISGWYSSSTSYNAGTGSTATSGLYSYGSTSSTDRALGTVAASSTPRINGARITNANAFVLTSFTLTYDGEQWRRGSNASQHSETLVFSYQIFDSGTGSIDAATGWTSISALNFTSPNATDPAPSALDGNASGNRVAGISSTINSFSWGAGKELWVRWTDPDDPGNDHGMAIDNVVFSAVPEPSTWILCALGGLFMVWNLRRRRTPASLAERNDRRIRG